MCTGKQMKIELCKSLWQGKPRKGDADSKIISPLLFHMCAHACAYVCTRVCVCVRACALGEAEPRSLNMQNIIATLSYTIHVHLFSWFLFYAFFARMIMA